MIVMVIVCTLNKHIIQEGYRRVTTIVTVRGGGVLINALGHLKT